MALRVLLTGAGGQLGRELLANPHPTLDFLAVDRSEFDISDPMSAARIATEEFGKLDWVVNAAAYTAVDRAEEDQQAAFESNALGPALLARACAMSGARLLHISTDFVFDGQARRPYREEDPPNPLGVYGGSKLEGERSAIASNPTTIVVRTSWLYSPLGACFPRAMIRAYEQGKHLRVVNDQTGTPTYGADLALTLQRLLTTGSEPGTYHAAGPEAMTWHQFATETLRLWTGNTSLEIEAVPTSEFPTKAKRPPYSALDCKKLSETECNVQRPVREALFDFVQRLRATGMPV